MEPKRLSFVGFQWRQLRKSRGHFLLSLLDAPFPSVLTTFPFQKRLEFDFLPILLPGHLGAVGWEWGEGGAWGGGWNVGLGGLTGGSLVVGGLGSSPTLPLASRLPRLCGPQFPHLQGGGAHLDCCRPTWHVLWGRPFCLG